MFRKWIRVCRKFQFLDLEDVEEEQKKLGFVSWNLQNEVRECQLSFKIRVKNILIVSGIVGLFNLIS